MKKFTFYKQLNAMDCGPTCLRMVAKSYGRHYNTEILRKIAGFSKEGVSLLGISDTAEKIGFRTRGVKITYEQLNNAPRPCILHWDQNHFVVLLKLNRRTIRVADPAKGIIDYERCGFERHWSSSKNEESKNTGIVLLLEPTPVFYEQRSQKENKLDWSLVLQYLRNTRSQIVQVFAALIITSLISLVLPFLTQAIVDRGISTRNLQFVAIILIAQLTLVFSQTIVGFIRSRLLLRVSNILNLQILSDFWIKLTRLPVSYFDVHHTGDTLQRLDDHRTIQNFLTGTALTTLFSFFNFLIYAVVLIIYNIHLFFIFIFCSIVYFAWVIIFLKYRRLINYEIFHLSAKENNATLQLIQGMQDIRMNNAEKQKRWEWENVQVGLFKLNFKSLNYNQIQSAGATLINQVQGICISYIVTKLVIGGQLSFGAMLAIQYIIGQLSGPIEQWVSFIQSLQDAKISMERLNEIHQLDNEVNVDKTYIQQLPEQRNIVLSNLSFTYPGAGNRPVLDKINLVIPEKKITAIVGTSGSGKTTLVKLLLKIYEQYEGEIEVGDIQTSGNPRSVSFGEISHQYWRSICGSVLQESYIFNDTIARNIAIGQETIDQELLIRSCRIASIHSFIEGLPNGYHTKLGVDGMGFSQGQRQRILIARAVYKNPDFLFFDEATNSLDANNEREIVENLELFFKGKTVVVVAHRLSTVKNADKIVVIDQGKIAEEGTHEELSVLKGKYFELVRNQLELGS